MGRKRLLSEEYRQGLADRYGEEILIDYDSIFSGDITLAGISRKYKISKMRASQIFMRLYGKTFRKLKKAGSAVSSEGKRVTFEQGKNKHFMIAIPEELHSRLKAYSGHTGLSMAVIARDCLSDFFNKDNLSKLGKFF